MTLRLTLVALPRKKVVTHFHSYRVRIPLITLQKFTNRYQYSKVTFETKSNQKILCLFRRFFLVRDVVFTFWRKLVFSSKRIDVLKIFQYHKIAVDTLNSNLQNHNLKAHSVSEVNNNDDLKTIGWRQQKNATLGSVDKQYFSNLCTISLG